MNTQWTQESLARLDARLAAGLPIGSGTEDHACIMASVRLALDPSAGLSDELPCVSPALRTWAITINDSASWASEADRAIGLRPLALVMPGTVRLADSDVMAVLFRVAYACADRAVRVDAPAALDRAGLLDRAAALRALPKIVDRPTANAAYAAANAANAAYAAYAANAAYADADAANAAYAAANAAYAAYAAADANQVLADAVQQVADGIAKLMEVAK